MKEREREGVPNCRMVRSIERWLLRRQTKGTWGLEAGRALSPRRGWTGMKQPCCAFGR